MNEGTGAGCGVQGKFYFFILILIPCSSVLYSKRGYSLIRSTKAASVP